MKETVKHVEKGLRRREEQLIKLLVSRACANLKYSFKTPLSHNRKL